MKNKNANINMTSGQTFPLICAFTIPLLVGNLLQQVYSLTDAAVVGRYIGVNALAAVGCTSWFLWIILAIARDLSNAFSITASYRFGNHNYEELAAICATGSMTVMLAALFITAVFLSFLPGILNILKVDPAILGDARAYLSIYLLSVPFLFAFNLSSGLLRAVGNSRITSVSMTISTVVNIVLDLVLVIRFKAGVKGVAIATLISQMIAASICSRSFIKSGLIGLPTHALHIDLRLLKETLHLYYPMFINEIVIASGGILVQRSINGLGAYFSAGISACNKVNSVMETIIISLASFISVYIGQNLGAKEYQRIRSGLSDTIKVSMVLTVVIAFVEWFFARKLVSCFLSTSDINMYIKAESVATTQLKVFAINFFFWTPMYIYRACIQAIGHSEYALYSGVVQLVFRIISISILPIIIGVRAYFCPTLLATIFCLPVVMIPSIKKIKSYVNVKL